MCLACNLQPCSWIFNSVNWTIFHSWCGLWPGYSWYGTLPCIWFMEFHITAIMEKNNCVGVLKIKQYMDEQQGRVAVMNHNMYVSELRQRFRPFLIMSVLSSTAQWTSSKTPSGHMRGAVIVLYCMQGIILWTLACLLKDWPSLIQRLDTGTYFSQMKGGTQGPKELCARV